MTDDIDGDDGWRATEMPAGSNDDSDGDLMGVMGVMGRDHRPLLSVDKGLLSTSETLSKGRENYSTFIDSVW